MALPGQLAGLDAIAMRTVSPVLRGAVEEDMLVGTNAIHHGQGGALGMHCGTTTLHELHQLLLLLGALDIGGIEYRQQLWTISENLRIHAMRIIQAQRGAVQYLRCLENALEAALKKQKMSWATGYTEYIEYRVSTHGPLMGSCHWKSGTFATLKVQEVNQRQSTTTACGLKKKKNYILHTFRRRP